MRNGRTQQPWSARQRNFILISNNTNCQFIKFYLAPETRNLLIFFVVVDCCLARRRRRLPLLLLPSACCVVIYLWWCTFVSLYFLWIRRSFALQWQLATDRSLHTSTHTHPNPNNFPSTYFSAK